MTIEKTILEELHQIEEKFGVKVLFAIESGSRGWGFASPDSDYDVRFVYLHPKEWYLSIDEKRDVIERPIDEILDIGGWDFRKILRLTQKSNAVIWEWLQSPIVYIDHDNFLRHCFELFRPYYSSISSANHYRSMAKRTVKEHLTGEKILLKKYFYILRPLLSAWWIVDNGGIPPMEFEKLLSLVEDNADLLESIEYLVEQKRGVGEKYLIARVGLVDSFIMEMLSYLDEKIISLSFEKPSIEGLNEFYRTTLSKSW